MELASPFGAQPLHVSPPRRRPSNLKPRSSWRTLRFGNPLGVLRRSVKRPKLTSADRLLWTWLLEFGAIDDLPWSSSSGSRHRLAPQGLPAVLDIENFGTGSQVDRRSRKT